MASQKACKSYKKDKIVEDNVILIVHSRKAKLVEPKYCWNPEIAWKACLEQERQLRELEEMLMRFQDCSATSENSTLCLKRPLPTAAGGDAGKIFLRRENYIKWSRQTWRVHQTSNGNPRWEKHLNIRKLFVQHNSLPRVPYSTNWKGKRKRYRPSP